MNCDHDVPIFLSAKAGSFSGVPQRTVQAWTEKGLVGSTGTTGSGKRRRYSVLNCVEIAIVQSLAQDRLSIKLIGIIMEKLRQGCPLTLKKTLELEYPSYLVVLFPCTMDIPVLNPKVYCISRVSYGCESKSLTRFRRYWAAISVPNSKTLALNLTCVSSKAIKKIVDSGERVIF